jgi:hypothetical protein
MSPEFPAYPGNGTNFTAVDCYFGFRCLGVLHISGNAADKDTSDFVGCDFVYEDGAAPLDVMAPTSNGQDHCTYINRGVSFSATRCRFLKSHGGGEGWLHYGHGAGIGIKPLYSKCDDSYFGPGVTNQMLTGSFAPTVVTGCEFRTGSGGNAVLL